MRLAKRLAIVSSPQACRCRLSGTGALSSESKCRQLEDLARQYAGVKLTSHQQQLKRKMVAWYNGNCKRTRDVHARRTIER